MDGWGGMYDFGLDRRRRRMITRGFGRMDLGWITMSKMETMMITMMITRGFGRMDG